MARETVVDSFEFQEGIFDYYHYIPLQTDLAGHHGTYSNILEVVEECKFEASLGYIMSSRAT
jgi:hypothetical protein